MYINSLESFQSNIKNNLKTSNYLHKNNISVSELKNDSVLLSSLQAQGQNNIAFQGVNTKLMANVGKKLAPFALLTGLMVATPKLSAQTNDVQNNQEMVSAPKPFKLVQKQRELNTKIFAYEIVDMLINAEKRQKYVVENANKDISDKLWVLNDNLKLADSTETLNKFIKAVENSEFKGVPKAFSDINNSHLDSIQKNKLIDDIKSLKEEKLKNLVNISVPDSLNNVLSSPGAIKERKDAVDGLLKEINVEIDNSSKEKGIQESVVATCNKTIKENLERKKQVLNLKFELAKSEIDTTSFSSEIVLFDETIKNAQETNIEALKAIAKHTLVLEKLNILKTGLSAEAYRLNGILSELNDIATFTSEAEELREEKFNAEEKDLNKTTKKAKSNLKQTQKSLEKQSGKTDAHTGEASSSGKVKKSTQKSYDTRNVKTKNKTEDTAAIVNILNKKQEIVNKHNERMTELNQLRGIVEESN